MCDTPVLLHRRLLAVSMVGLSAVVFGCASLPTPAPSVDQARIQTILATRLDTLIVGSATFLAYYDQKTFDDLREMRDSLVAIGLTTGSDSLRLQYLNHQLTKPDSIESAYHRGVRDATHDLARGHFILKIYGLGKRFRHFGRWWCADNVFGSVMRREYQVELERVAGDAIYDSGLIAYADAYNRVVEPVLNAYWGEEDVRRRAWNQMEKYVKKAGWAHRREWSCKS